MYANPAGGETSPVTLPQLMQARRDGRRLTMLTCYDAGFARAIDAAGVDTVLVGDSLGMVVQGHGSTLPVTVADIEYHVSCVARGLQHALLLADMPFQSDATQAAALDAATRFLRAGAAMVKIEGAGFKLDVIRALVEREIPVCAHLGLTPQSVLRLGGYRVQGRDEEAAARMLDDARAVEAAGASMLVLECVPSPLAARITHALTIPTIGIGAGPGCDGQVLVLHDMLGLRHGRRPRFVKDFLADGGSIQGAIEAFVREVRDGTFPAAEHGYA
ncbi:3-methyl-2-oxobutanoate hydroxymethyltransferase [Cognatilysobacter lacus]|uniref:3-methyl-2-oxobutanoate hydroxymethyltransferase n=1 Tax=Cognatilysobacter lacus TaxID=1643323 RepID=A0A5D8Z7B2_9GAMM|nr:3-methyl-2-oxobutanoate hydroxymethyltransferase [Lysobacter lacus]TZF90570.1 3-methyl-2-oxobutanoate hydroxymethyltransferase [Lysobacter lacus]